MNTKNKNTWGIDTNGVNVTISLTVYVQFLRAEVRKHININYDQLIHVYFVCVCVCV